MQSDYAILRTHAWALSLCTQCDNALTSKGSMFSCISISKIIVILGPDFIFPPYSGKSTYIVLWYFLMDWSHQVVQVATQKCIIFNADHDKHYPTIPYHPCMVYLPTFGWFLWEMYLNVPLRWMLWVWFPNLPVQCFNKYFAFGCTRLLNEKTWLFLCCMYHFNSIKFDKIFP